MAARKVIIGKCATTTRPKICGICDIYEFLRGHTCACDGRPVVAERQREHPDS